MQTWNTKKCGKVYYSWQVFWFSITLIPQIRANPRTGLTVRGVDIRGNIFGGGNKAAVTGNTNVNIGRPETVTTP